MDLGRRGLPVKDPHSLIAFHRGQETTVAEGPHLEKESGKRGKKQNINPFLRKISGCPFRVGYGRSSFFKPHFSLPVA